jgi:hypothetical protein
VGHPTTHPTSPSLHRAHLAHASFGLPPAPGTPLSHPSVTPLPRSHPGASYNAAGHMPIAAGSTLLHVDCSSTWQLLRQQVA